MNYFDIQVHPDETTRGLIIVNGFHPRWQEAIPVLMNTVRIEDRINEYLDKFNKDYKLAATAEFSGETGLMHLRFWDRTSVDLSENRRYYSSHNMALSNAKELVTSLSVLQRYFSYMKSAISTLESK